MLGLCALCMAGGDVFAAAVCSNTPEAGDHIECTEDSTSTSDIDIDAAGLDIDVNGIATAGVRAKHNGSGDVSIRITGETTGDATTASTIDVMGPVLLRCPWCA